LNSTSGTKTHSTIKQDISQTINASQPSIQYNYTHWVTKLPGKFAYVYLVGGCDPKKPSYQNYFYDIMVSTYNQRLENSQADIIVLVQIKYKSRFDKLLDEDVHLLDAMNIKVQYIPKSSTESFYKIMMDKFRILALTQYERVFFMDSDVMALGNMDYIFEMSKNGTLKENVIFAGINEPANGGTFMLTPKEGSWERIIQIIKRKESRGKQLQYPHWDDGVGWGHEIDNATDFYQFANGRKGYLWNYYGAFADQGLLYHWVKYEQKSVSIIFKKTIQNWGVGANGDVTLQQTIGIATIAPTITVNRTCWTGFMSQNPCVPPHSDYVHFTGGKKPWLRGPPKDFGAADMKSSPAHSWFHVLSILNTELNIGLNFSDWKTGQRPAFGLYPKHVDAANTEYHTTLQTT
jgi:hypothetical protein